MSEAEERFQNNAYITRLQNDLGVTASKLEEAQSRIIYYERWSRTPVAEITKLHKQLAESARKLEDAEHRYEREYTLVEQIKAERDGLQQQLADKISDAAEWHQTAIERAQQIRSIERQLAAARAEQHAECVRLLRWKYGYGPFRLTRDASLDKLVNEIADWLESQKP